METRQKNSYLKNAGILTGTGLLLRLVGMGFRVYLAGRLGAEGMGLYQLIFSLYNLCITVATAGISVTATRLVAEELSAGKTASAVGVLRRVMALGALAGGGAATLQAATAGVAARYWLGDVRATNALLVLAPSLPFMAIAAALRGYFLARRRVQPNAQSQLLEQAVRIVLAMMALRWAQGRGIGWTCAAVVLGNTISEIFSCLCMLGFYRADRRQVLPPKKQAKAPVDTWQRISAMFWPVEGSRCMGSALRTAENMLVPACLAVFLGGREPALAQYGVLTGMTLPILLFPFSFLSALSTLIMPEITEAQIRGQNARAQVLIDRMIRITDAISVLLAGLLWLCAPQLGEALYHSAEAGTYLRILAPIAPLIYLESMVDGVLKGMGEQKRIFRYTIWDSLLRIAGVLALLPRLGMAGLLGVTLFSNAFTALLYIMRTLRVADMKPVWGAWVVRPLASLAAALLVAGLVKRLWPLPGAWLQAAALCTVAAGVYVGLYAPSLRRWLHTAVQR